MAVQETVYTSVSDVIAGLVRDFSQATKSVVLEVYILEFGDLAEPLLSAMTAAAARGVRCSLQVDSFGSPGFFGDRVDALQKAGVMVRVYRPVPWNFRHWRLAKRLTGKFRLQRRDHRKLAAIDGRTIWVGSMNISDTMKDWSEIALRTVFDEEVATFSADGSTVFKENVLGPKGPVRINTTRALRRELYRDLFFRIMEAKKRVWIVSPYFAPGHSLFRRLLRAARRGCDVRLIVPKTSDVFFFPWVTMQYYHLLAHHRVQVYEYRPAMLHAKAVWIDGWSAVGSTNWNHRSFIHDLELDLVAQRPETVVTLEKHLEKLISDSDRVEVRKWTALSHLKRSIGVLLYRIFRYII